MDRQTSHILRTITNDFYRDNCASFSATRSAPWTGWKRCIALLEEQGFWGTSPGAARADDTDKTTRRDTTVFDLACGNLRFEDYLASTFAEDARDVAFAFHAVDNCDELLAGTDVAARPTVSSVDYQSLDVLDLLEAGEDLTAHLAAPVCDLSVSFGFLHHVPLREDCERVLSALVGRTRPGGYIIVSFWRFLANEALARKARLTHAQALEDLGLEEAAHQFSSNDLLLGWQDRPGAYRYCHSFTEAEIDELALSITDTARAVSRFTADGRTCDLNSYLILKRI